MVYCAKKNKKQSKNVVKKNLFFSIISIFIVLFLEACANSAPVDPHFQEQQAVFTNRTVTIGQAQLNPKTKLYD